MKKFSKVLALVMVLLLVFSVFAGCGSKPAETSDGSDSTAAAEQPKISAILMALNSDYWHMVEAGCINGGKELGADVTVMGPTNEADVTGQIAMIEDQITAGAKGLIIAPTDPKAILPALQKAKDKGIPVVLIDSDIAEDVQDLRASFIGTSEYEAGKEVGKYLTEKLQPGASVGMLRGLAGLPSHDARVNGCKEVLEAAGFKVVSVQPADSDRGKAVNVTENMLESFPEISCIYATNDEMALGAYQAAEGRQRTDIFIVGFDGSPDALKSIQAGKLGGSLAQKPIEMGYKGVDAILQLLDGKQLETRIFTSVQLVDATNVEEFQKNLNAELEKAKQ